jgi:putative ABC transport system substrate-binding protein
MFKKIIAVIIFVSVLFMAFNRDISNIPIIGVANFGPHSSLQDSIQGLQSEMKKMGYDQKIRFEVLNTNFDPSLIGQMLAKLKSTQPKAIIALTTPVAQMAQNTIKDIPIIFSCITDPLEAGISGPGMSDKPDLNILLRFAKKILPQAKTVGILYAIGDANDAALLKMMTAAAKQTGMNVFPVSIEQSRDIPMRMAAFKDKVDFIYVGVGASIQPALPAIIAHANKMKIPVFNADSDAVKKHQVLASFGVNYTQIGASTARILDQILKGEKNILAQDPLEADHQGFISSLQAKKFNIEIPKGLPNLTIVGE